MHDGHVGGPKQYNNSPLGKKLYFYANIFYCFSPPTWPPCTHSIGKLLEGFSYFDVSLLMLCYVFFLSSTFMGMLSFTVFFPCSPRIITR